MARWKLTAPHYLKTEGVEWEYQELDRKTNRQVRRKFEVPVYLDPRDPGDWNNRWGSKDNEDGEVIVCYKGRGEGRDYVFFGNPTPDMVPIDDEAREISARFTTQWSFKPETDTPGDFSQSLVDKFQAEMAEIENKPVQIEGMAELVTAMAASQAQTTELIKSLAIRRV